jgi:hypothetical protein
VESALEHCPFVPEIKDFRFVYSPNKDEWTFLTLRITCEFPDGSKLIVLEIFSRQPVSKMRLSNGPVSKKKSYHYQNSSGDLIFRLDCHGVQVPLDGPLHLDIPNNPGLLDGDPLLRGASVAQADFFSALKWARMYIEGDLPPWEARNG